MLEIFLCLKKNSVEIWLNFKKKIEKNFCDFFIFEKKVG